MGSWRQDDFVSVIRPLVWRAVQLRRERYGVNGEKRVIPSAVVSPSVTIGTDDTSMSGQRQT
jgi:hypothetical protein